jgi:hypothetical protein
MIYAIPTFSDDSYLQRTTLEGATYVLAFDFNQRAASWYLSVADLDGVDIVNGVKLVTGFSLLGKCRDPRAPLGVLYVVSSTSDGSPPGQFDLLDGGRCTLLYMSSDWVAILLAGGIASLQAQVASNTQASTPSTYGQTPTGA